MLGSSLLHNSGEAMMQWKRGETKRVLLTDFTFKLPHLVGKFHFTLNGCGKIMVFLGNNFWELQQYVSTMVYLLCLLNFVEFTRCPREVRAVFFWCAKL